MPLKDTIIAFVKPSKSKKKLVGRGLQRQPVYPLF